MCLLQSGQFPLLLRFSSLLCGLFPIPLHLAGLPAHLRQIADFLGGRLQFLSSPRSTIAVLKKDDGSVIPPVVPNYNASLCASIEALQLTKVGDRCGALVEPCLEKQKRCLCCNC